MNALNGCGFSKEVEVFVTNETKKILGKGEVSPIILIQSYLSEKHEKLRQKVCKSWYIGFLKKTRLTKFIAIEEEVAMQNIREFYSANLHFNDTQSYIDAFTEFGKKNQIIFEI